MRRERGAAATLLVLGLCGLALLGAAALMRTTEALLAATRVEAAGQAAAAAAGQSLLRSLPQPVRRSGTRGPELEAESVREAVEAAERWAARYGARLSRFHLEALPGGGWTIGLEATVSPVDPGPPWPQDRPLRARARAGVLLVPTASGWRLWSAAP